MRLSMKLVSHGRSSIAMVTGLPTKAKELLAFQQGELCGRTGPFFEAEDEVDSRELLL